MANARGAVRYIRVFIGALIALVIGVFAILRINYVDNIEFESRLGMPSQSSAAAERDSVLERRPPVTTPVIQVPDHGPITITDAWIERRSRIVYKYYVFRLREAVPGYMLSYTLSPDAGPWVNKSGGRFGLTSSNNAESRIAKIGSTSVSYRHITLPLPDSLRFRVCESKRDERGQPRPNLHDELPECIDRPADG